MYTNCVFDAKLNNNKWVYILQGHFLNWLKTIANLTKIDILRSWPWICIYWPEYETFFLQLESRRWTCKNNIDWQVSYNNMT